ncbi:MAG: sialidase family protein [Acidimicrobiales bacterium]
MPGSKREPASIEDSSGGTRWRRRARRVGLTTTALGFAMLVPGGLGGGLGLAGVAGATTTSSGAAPTVEAARQVDGNAAPDRLFILPQIAVDPANPNTVVISAGDYRDGGCDLFASTNGGLSWANTTSSLLSPPSNFCAVKPYGRYTAPAFTPSGNKLYVAMDNQATATEHNGQNGPGGVQIASTSDLGLTHQTTTVQPSLTLPATTGKGKAKKPIMDPTSARAVSLGIDPSNPSYMYVANDISSTKTASGLSASLVHSEVSVTVSSDAGATWGKPILLPMSSTNPSASPAGAFGPPALAVGKDGAVYAFGFENLPMSAPSNAKTAVLMFKSTDHGKTWTTSTVNAGNLSSGLMEAAISPLNGDVYVVWDGNNAMSAVSMQNASNQTNQVYEATSTDGGKTWSPARNVGDANMRNKADEYYGGISVAPNGRVDVAWYDFRNDPVHPQGQYEQFANIYYSYSTNNGATWSTNLRASDRSMDTSLGVTFPYFAIGQVGVASTDNAAYITWGDPRNSNQVNQVEDAYMTRVDFTNPMTPVSATMPTGTKVELGGAGAGALLILIGVGLVLGLARPGRRRPATATSSSEASSSEASKT